MLVLERKCGEAVFVGPVLVVTLVAFSVRAAMVETRRRDSGRRATSMIPWGRRVQLTEAVSVMAVSQGRGRARLGFEAPRDVAIERDDMKRRPEVAA